MHIEEIDFYKKNWLIESLKIRTIEFLSDEYSPVENHEDKLLESSIKTGFIFGHPIELFFKGDIEGLYFLERQKLIYFDHFFQIFLHFENKIEKNKNQEVLISDFLKYFNEFRLQVFPDFPIPLLSKKSNHAKNTENFFDKRIAIITDWKDSFFERYFYNGLLFSDIILWGKFLKLNFSFSHDDIFEIRIQFYHFINEFFHQLLSVDTIEMDESVLNYLSIEKYRNIKTEKSLSYQKSNSDLKSWMGKIDSEFINYFTLMYFRTIGYRSEYDLQLIEIITKNTKFDRLQYYGYQLNTTIFILQNWKKLKQISTKNSIKKITEFQKDILKEAATKFKNELKLSLDSNSIISMLLKNRKYLDLNWTEKDELKREMMLCLYSLIGVKNPPENNINISLVNLTEIFSEELLPEGIGNIMIDKRGKRTIYE